MQPITPSKKCDRATAIPDDVDVEWGSVVWGRWFSPKCELTGESERRGKYM